MAVVKLDGIWRALPDVDDSGEKRGFYKVDYDDSQWYDIRVPGHWQEEIEDLKNYSGVVWYRKKFNWKGSNRRVWLRFRGVFYKAKVWLNGEELGGHEGYFASFKFDITTIIREENVLAVKVESRDEEDINRKVQVGGIFYHWDCRDPTFNPGGIWGGVEIYETGDVWIERIKVIPRIHEGYAEVEVAVWINSAISSNVRLVANISPKNFMGKEIRLEKEVSVKQGNNFFMFRIRIDDPKLWWTWDLGKQNLYTLRLEVLINNEPSDSKEVIFGIKEVRLVKKRSGWVFYLNGKRIFIRGTNYGPTSQRLAYVTREDMERDVRMMREANINMVRIHAHISPELLSIFDEYGILVWQDFPLQWQYSKKIKRVAIENAKEFIHVIENHACLGIICCHNEPFKFPTKKDILSGTIAFVLSLLLSLLFGTLGLRLGSVWVRIPLWIDIIHLLEKNFGPIRIGTLIGIALLFMLYPAMALAAGGYEALISTIILGALLPWDVTLFFVIFLFCFGNSVATITWNWNKNVLDKNLEKTMREEDMGVHPILRHSGMFGWFIDGMDIHIYDGWYSGWLIPLRRFRGYRHVGQFRGLFRNVPRFVSEYGAQAFPSIESLMKMLPENIINAIREKGFGKAYREMARYLSKYHQYQPNFMRLWIDPQKYGTLEEFIEATQEYQAELIRFYNEYWRSRRFSPVGGAMQFMFTDIAPLITWAVVDYWRKPKKAYYELKKSFRPLHIFMEWPKPRYKPGKKYRLKIYIVNDYHKKFQGEASLKLDGDIIWTKNIEIPPDSLQKHMVPVVFRKKGISKVVLELRVGEERIVNEYMIRAK